jgi:hypothetical protein
LPLGYAGVVERTLDDPRTVLGAFRLRFDAPPPALRLLARLADIARTGGVLPPYGDQGLFLKATTFRTLGGFRELPLMEDYDLARRAGRQGAVRLAPAAVVTSARRWRALGVWRNASINALVALGFETGVEPSRLAALYFGRPRRG